MNNQVTLLGWYGGDKRVCLSAWQSTTEELGIQLPTTIEDRVDVIFQYLATQKKKTPDELLDMLALDGHGTPFEKAIVDFQITGDLASHIHSLKHRISAINAESARYKEFLTDRYYLPDDWNGIKFSQEAQEALSNSTVTAAGIPVLTDNWSEALEEYVQTGYSLYHIALADLEPVLGRKRAKESARYFLGYTTQLNYDWQMNWRSFVNIQRLRNDSHAQREIHQIANSMLYLVQTIPGNPFAGCIRAFGLEVDPQYLLPGLVD